MTQLHSRRIALMLESDGPGGAEVVVLQLGEELRRRGHEILFVGPKQGNGWLGKRFAEIGIEAATFTKYHPLDPRWVRDLYQLLKSRKIDTVHAHEFAMAFYGTAAARLLGLPIVNTFHGAEWMTSARRRRIALRWTIANAHFSCAVSTATQQQLVEDLNLPTENLQVVRNGVPFRSGTASRIREELQIDGAEILVLAVGNLEQRKGHLLLLEALNRLRGDSDVPKWRLVIAGGRGGPMKGPLQEFITQHGLADSVHILTFRSDIPDLQAAADIFVMPSLWEGLPLALLEAMLAGNPVIASATSGIPEAIVDERDGFLVPPGEVMPLANRLRELMCDPALRERLGRAALSRARAEFTIGVMADRYEAAYSASLDSIIKH